jgi:hypothetical protein
MFELLGFYIRYAMKYLMHQSGIHVEKIIVFDETFGEDYPSYEYVSRHLTLDEIKRNLTISLYRIEIRYVIHGKKYRCVIRESDDVHFPIRKELGIRSNAQIRRAVLTTVGGDTVDVTSRVRKYAGQNNDFNSHAGYLFFVRDMFSFEDVDELSTLTLELCDNSVHDFNMNNLMII